MVSGYLSGSISRSSSATGVTQPAQILTRGKTAASRTRGRSPRRASCHAAVLPPGPPPTTMTSCAAIVFSASPEREEEPHLPQGRELDVLDRVGHLHGGEHVTLEVERALHVGFREVVGRRIAEEPDKGLRRFDDGGADGLPVAEPHLPPVP